MSKTAVRPVQRAIEYMHERYSEPISVDCIAREAMYSKFHFTRIFRQLTGISPGRFLSAIRVQESKRLLLTTDLSVLSISIQVGYNSMGTFSSRFSRIVGVSPKMFRKLNGYAPPALMDSFRTDGVVGGDPHQSVRGMLEIDAAERLPGPVLVGLFPERIPQGSPNSCMILDGPGPFTLTGVRPGTWNLLASSWAADPMDHEGMWNHDLQRSYIGTYGPLRVSSQELRMPVSVKLRQRTVFDPPILMALPNLREPHLFYERAAGF